MSIESVIQSSHLVLCHPPLLLLFIFPSIKVFSSELALYIRGSKDWSLRLSISPSNEYEGLTSFRIDWFDLLAFQGTFKNFLQHHSSKTSVLQCSAFFMAHTCLWTNCMIHTILTSIHDYWNNHSFDYMSICQQTNPDKETKEMRRLCYVVSLDWIWEQNRTIDEKLAKFQ